MSVSTATASGSPCAPLPTSSALRTDSEYQTGSPLRGSIDSSASKGRLSANASVAAANASRTASRWPNSSVSVEPAAPPASKPSKRSKRRLQRTR